ncbi:hypothetical protein ADP8_05257 (plasmid) [Roseomonas mucosa]|nr:hypothetical protein ADP8_05257 [Roseomonas mucosa]
MMVRPAQAGRARVRLRPGRARRRCWQAGGQAKARRDPPRRYPARRHHQPLWHSASPPRRRPGRSGQPDASKNVAVETLI